MSPRALMVAACASVVILTAPGAHARKPEGASPTATGPATPKAAPAASPSPARSCAELWSVAKVCTIGKGQGSSNNAKLSHCVTGNIVNPGAIAATAHRIPVCRGTEVTVVVTDTTGTPTNTAEGRLSCDASGCTGVVDRVEKYKSVSQDGKDSDRIALLPE